jgi:hypothetical protein
MIAVSAVDIATGLHEGGGLLAQVIVRGIEGKPIDEDAWLPISSSRHHRAAIR